MTSRERIIATLEGKVPDKVPVDLGAHPSSGISAMAYGNLLEHLGIEGRVRITDTIQQLAWIDDPVLDRFGIDVIDAARAVTSDDSQWHSTVMANGKQAFYPAWFHPEQDESGAWYAKNSAGLAIAKMPAGAAFFDQVHFPWKEGYPDSRSGMEEQLDEAMREVMWTAFSRSPWEHMTGEDKWGELRKRVTLLRDSTERALLITFGGSVFEYGTYLRRIDNFLMDLYTEQDRVAMLVEMLLERYKKTLVSLCESVGDLVDIVQLSDDLGMDSGPFMGLDVYRSLFHEARKELASCIHQNSSMKTLIHSCGSVEMYIPSMVEEGIDILNPVQTNCRDMAPELLKERHGKNIVFWGGGVDPREILNNGTPEQVRGDVLRRLEVFAKGGGYVFNSIHNILPEVPPENIVAMFDAVAEFNGNYA